MTPLASWSLLGAIMLLVIVLPITLRAMARREREWEQRVHDLHRRYGSHRRVS